MRHITPPGLDAIEPLLQRLRTVPDLVERKRGVFYRRSNAFLHFHEDGGDVYADVKLGGDGFERMRVTTKAEKDALVQAVRACVGTPVKGRAATR
jgi:hypothetical protein